MSPTFADFREAFHDWAREVYDEVTGADLDEIEELQKWLDEEEEAFLQFVREKLKPHESRFQTPSLHSHLLTSMINEACTRDSDFTEFLISVEQNPDDVTTFFEFLQVFCTFV